MSIIGIALLLTATAASPVADPLEPARRGLAACSEPLSTSTGVSCEVVATYQFTADGQIVETLRMTIPMEPPVEMILVDRVALIDGAVCGRIDPAVIRNARFERNGAMVDGPELNALKETVITAMAGFSGKMACMRHLGTGGIFSTEAWLDGKELKEERSKTTWIAPERASLRPISPE